MHHQPEKEAALVCCFNLPNLLCAELIRQTKEEYLVSRG
jgi:hypothetical protein